MSGIFRKWQRWIEDQTANDQWADWLFIIPSFFLSFTLIFMLHRILKRVVCRRMERRPWLQFLHMVLSAPHWPLFLAFAIYVSLIISPIPTEYTPYFNRGFGLGLILQIGFWLNAILHYSLTHVMERGNDPSRTTVLKAISVIAKMVLWLAVFLLLLDNFGVNITTLVAGLGIGGIAIALAVQKILGDVFGSLSIVLDRPFVIGDFINVGGDMGTVENIGIKTTRLKALTGETLIFSNSDLLESRIRNFTQMRERRVEAKVGIVYELSPAKVRQAVQIVREAIDSEPGARVDWVRFFNFGDYSLDIKMAFWVSTADYGKFAEMQENIFLRIMDEYAKNGIEFAYPTQRQYHDPSYFSNLAKIQNEGERSQ